MLMIELCWSKLDAYVWLESDAMAEAGRAASLGTGGRRCRSRPSKRGSAGSICANISFEMSRRLEIGRIVFKLFQNVSQQTDVDRKRCNYPSGATCFSAKSRIFSQEFSEAAVVGDPTLIGTRQICWTVGWLDNEGTTQFSWRNGA